MTDVIKRTEGHLKTLGCYADPKTRSLLKELMDILEVTRLERDTLRWNE